MKPGHILKNLYEILPVIFCPVCEERSEVRILSNLYNSEGGNLDTKELTLYQFKTAEVGTLKCYSFNIWNNKVNIYLTRRTPGLGEKIIYTQPGDRMETISDLNIYTHYCMRPEQDIYKDLRSRINYPHFHQTFKCTVDPQLRKLTEIKLTQFGMINKLNEQYVTVKVDENSTTIGRSIDVHFDTHTIKTGVISMERAADIIRSNKYMNLL